MVIQPLAGRARTRTERVAAAERQAICCGGEAGILETLGNLSLLVWTEAFGYSYLF